MDRQSRNRHLVEHILALVELLQDSPLELSRFIEEGVPEQYALPDGPSLRAACNLIQFMDEMPGGFLIYCAQEGERIIYANRWLLRIFQCENMAEFRKLTGNSFRGMVHPEDLEEVEESIREQIAASQYDLDYVEYRIVRKDGAIRWIEDYGHFIQSASAGGIFYVFLGDATEKWERRQHERTALIQEKRRHEQKLQALIEEYDKERALINQEYLRRLEVIEGLSVNYESILYADLDRDQLLPYRMSTRAEAVSEEGVRAQGFRGFLTRYVGVWVHPEDRELFLQKASPDHIREKLSGSDTYYQNYRILEDGETRYLQLRVVDVGRTRRVSQVVMGYRRVDAEFQQEVEQKQMLADALNNANLAIVAKNTFLSNMSHDMRTPLNAIFGFTSLARRNAGDPQAVLSYLDRIEASSRQLLDLIDKVLEIAWTDSRELRSAEVECDLRSIVEEACEFLRSQAEEKDIDFTVDCRGMGAGMICSDPDKLRQLVTYLVNNAVTYTKPGGRVSVTAARLETLPNQRALCQLVVADTGVGISREFLERIFEPFSREKNTTLSGIHGIGLGLSIAKNIADMLGGTIAVESEEGRGTTFTATFRFRTPRPAPAAGIARAVCRRILLVEDNELNMEIETELLGELGFHIEPAGNGKEALERVAASAPGEIDLILMDIQMPVMDGWQASQAIRALPDPALAGIPIIALSANVFESDIQRSMECGMNAHLKKPLDVPALLRTIEETFSCPQ